MFFRSPFFLPWIYPDLLWRQPADEKTLYLTFDDGPIPAVTDFVLDTLKQRNVRATFFCIGENINKHPDIFNRIAKENHTIGNHTYNHLKGWNASTKEYVTNVEKCSDALGRDEKIFRPPYGRITKEQIKALQHYKIVMWDVLTQDYDRRLTEEKCLQGSINATRNGSIIVFHDSEKAERNMKYALPRYLDHFLNLGFDFKSIPLI